MEFLRDNVRFSFLYGGKNAWEYSYIKNIEEKGNEIVTKYLFDDGLKVTNVARYHHKYNAYEWVNYLENTGDKNSQIISELWDCDCQVTVKHTEKRRRTAYIPNPDLTAKIYAPFGSLCWEKDFICTPAYIFADEERVFRSKGGRSSNGENSPFFNIYHDNSGLLMAIGWTGQWNCKITRKENSVRLQSKIEDTKFFLYPGERIRTSSVVIMKYEGDFYESQNKWRRFLKEEFSPIGLGRVNETAPFCAGIWGGMKSEDVIKRIEKLNQNNIPIEYIWMDAGWYGGETTPTPDEFEGDWYTRTGDWRISPLIHPGGLNEVASLIKKSGKKFLLWFEPERAAKSVPMAKEHPEYFIEHPDEDDLLLNLGNQEAFNYCYETVSNIIRDLDIKCYRQDFNFDPLEYWRFRDDTDRKGITEIKHIVGLYNLWDKLTDEFPGLIIDNCSSGGRRIDIETLKRSVPLWRSDVQCPADYKTETAQMHNMNFSLWMPYSGTGSGRLYDTYRMRSAYAGGLTTNFTFSASDDFGSDEEKMGWLRKMGEEYLKVRPYFYGDIYHLTMTSTDESVWCASQWDRPEYKDGMIQVFKHAKSPYTEAIFKLKNINEKYKYLFTDADGGEVIIEGKELTDRGFSIKIEEKRVAKIFFYKKIVDIL